MKNYRAVWLIGALLAATGSVFLVGRAHFLVKETRAQTPQADVKEMVQVLRREELRGAARVKGHYVADFDPHWDFGRFDVDELTRNSAAVVVAVAGKNLGSKLTESGLAITTDYEVLVQDTIKGDILPGTGIVVGMTGGRVEFEDGTSAELKTPKFEHVKAGGSYILFLTEVSDKPGKFTLTGGPQGLLEMAFDGSVKSHGRDDDPIARQSKGKNKQAFIQDVRDAAKTWPKKGKC